jgi:hypothetical protein
MRRLLCRIFPGLLLLIAAPVVPATGHDGHRHTIEGRLEPELLPETSVWNHVIAALHSLTGGHTDPRHPEAHAFVAGNLYMSEGDAAILLEEVSAARARLRRLESRKSDECGGEDPNDYSACRKQIDAATLEARDKTLARLSPRGRKALLRWVAIIKQGMSHGPSR